MEAQAFPESLRPLWRFLMADLATLVEILPSNASVIDRKLKKSSNRRGILFFLVALVGGLGYIAFHVAKDMDAVTITSTWPYFLLGLALLIALGFEFFTTASTTRPTQSQRSSIPTRWSRTSLLCGPASAIWREFSPPPARWPSRSSPCFRSN